MQVKICTIAQWCMVTIRSPASSPTSRMGQANKPCTTWCLVLYIVFVLILKVVVVIVVIVVGVVVPGAASGHDGCDEHPDVPQGFLYITTTTTTTYIYIYIYIYIYVYTEWCCDSQHSDAPVRDHRRGPRGINSSSNTFAIDSLKKYNYCSEEL
jgi:heme/copper-type cytochrome/quinol oxidase subunit 2